MLSYVVQYFFNGQQHTSVGSVRAHNKGAFSIQRIQNYDVTCGSSSRQSSDPPKYTKAVAYAF